MQCNLERSEDKARWHVSRALGWERAGLLTDFTPTKPSRPQLTLLLVLEDRLHRQLTYDLLPSRQLGTPGCRPEGGWWVVPQPHASPRALAAADSAQDLATELVHYGFLREVGGVVACWEGTGCTRPLVPHVSLPSSGRPVEAGRLPRDHLPQVSWGPGLTLPPWRPCPGSAGSGPSTWGKAQHLLKLPSAREPAS